MHNSNYKKRLSCSLIILSVCVGNNGNRGRNRQGNFSSKRSKEKETEGRRKDGREKEGGGARRAGEQAFSVHRKISQPGRGPMPVNSVGRSLTR